VAAELAEDQGHQPHPGHDEGHQPEISGAAGADPENEQGVDTHHGGKVGERDTEVVEEREHP